jgi:hypothetical protein
MYIYIDIDIYIYINICIYIQAWEGILKHMDQRDMTRSFIQTLIHLIRLHPGLISQILSGSLYTVILKTIKIFGFELLEKIEKIIVLNSRGVDLNKHRPTVIASMGMFMYLQMFMCIYIYYYSCIYL